MTTHVMGDIKYTRENTSRDNTRYNTRDNTRDNKPDALVLRVGDDNLVSRMEDNVANVVVMTTARVNFPRARLVEPPQLHLSVIRT